MKEIVKRRDYWNWFLKQDDYTDVFRNNLTEQRERDIFSKYVMEVTIETSAACNRKCSYCPLAQINRKQDFIEPDKWNRILNELREIGFHGKVMLNYYNEPLLDPSIFQKVREVKQYLPEVTVGFDSNGDFLTRENLDLLSDSGLDWLLITRHVTREKFEKEKCKEDIETYIEKLGMKKYLTEYKELSQNNVTYQLKYGNMDIFVVCNNWKESGCDRGGVVSSLHDANVRCTPCINPIREFCISYEGIIKPCCNIYFGTGADYGKVDNEGILNTYFDKLQTFKMTMFRYGAKSGETVRKLALALN